MTATMQARGVKVVCRLLDGTMIKGSTNDFYPNKPHFHVQQASGSAALGTPVSVDSLKAVFFVETLEGNNHAPGPPQLRELVGSGRKLEVTFLDGEVIVGYTTAYNPSKPGFFIIPAEDASNNQRVYVLSHAIRQVTWR